MNLRCIRIALLTLFGSALTLVPIFIDGTSATEPTRARPATIRLAQETAPPAADVNLPPPIETKSPALDIKPPMTKVPPDWFAPPPKAGAKSTEQDIKPPMTQVPPDWFQKPSTANANPSAIDIKPPMTQIPPDWFQQPPPKPAEVVTPIPAVNCDWKPWYYCWYACHDCKPGPCAPNPCYPICCDHYCGKPLPCPPSPCYPTCPGCYCPKPPVCKFPGNPCPPCAK